MKLVTVNNVPTKTRTLSPKLSTLPFACRLQVAKLISKARKSRAYAGITSSKLVATPHSLWLSLSQGKVIDSHGEKMIQLEGKPRRPNISCGTTWK